MLSRRHCLSLLTLPLAPSLWAEDRCGARADAALTKIAGQLLPQLTPCMALCASLAGALSPAFLRAGRALSASELDQWHIKAAFVLAEEHRAISQQCQQWLPKSVRHALVVDTHGNTAAVTCADAAHSDAVLHSDWASKFWGSQQRVLSKAPFWALAGVLELLRNDELVLAEFEPLRRALVAPRELTYPLPFQLEGLESVAGLLAVALAHGEAKVQAEIHAEDGVLQNEVAADVLPGRQMKAVQRALLNSWHQVLAERFPEQRSGSYHRGLVKRLTGLLGEV